jgi:cytochrome c peroxidase
LVAKALVFALLGACSAATGPEDPPATDPPSQLSKQFDMLSPSKLPPPPPDVTNRFADDSRAAELGHRLFFDPSFSGRLIDTDNDGTNGTLGTTGETGKIMCAACHNPGAGFVDARSPRHQISLGAAWTIRKGRSLLDVGQAKLLMWDGRHDALYNQVFNPLESANEMNTSRLFVAEQMFQKYRSAYESIFGLMPALGDPAHFPVLAAARTGCADFDYGTRKGTDCHGMPGDGAEFDGMALEDQRAVTRVVVNMGKALGAYLRLLSCGQGRFDEWVHGNANALDPSEQRGATLFVGRGHCVACHSGPFFTDQQFHNVGLQPGSVAVSFVDIDDRGAAEGLGRAMGSPLNEKGEFSDADDGRLPAMISPEMEGAFRTPSLRCVSEHPSFLHTGQYRALEDVLDFFADGGHESGFVGKSELNPFNLSADDRTDLVAFLKTLRGAGPPAELLVAPP